MKSNRNSNNYLIVFTRHFGFILTLIIFSSGFLRAQLSLVNIGTAAGEEQSEPSGKNSGRVQAMILPFFDDFATTSTSHPNTTYWLSGSGVYVNNTLATTQPSLNIATFDGLNALGTPYNIANPSFQDNTDTLTSQSINLSGLTAKDSVYLSFYWLPKGLGERPDTLDAFRVEFKNRKNEWVEAWKHSGQVDQDSIFTQAFVVIKDTTYLHGDFQFRFRSYGRSSGPYDTWHLDYVYLDKNRSIQSPYIFDVAARRPLTSLLKNYTAMPLKQFQQNMTVAKADFVVADVSNNFNKFNVLTGTFTILDASSKLEYFKSVQSSVNIGALRSAEFKIALSALNLPAKQTSLNLLSKFFITTTDNATPGVNLYRNDTITATTSLSDYYSFDDGSAEFGIQMNQKLGRAAVRFALAKPDTVAGVRMNIIPFGKDVSGQSFNVQLWSNKGGKPDQLLAQRSVSAKYPADRNGFLEFPFISAVAVKDTFYVGWLQINEQAIVMGYDRNSSLGKDKIFFNLGPEWVNEKSLKGSIMIRPYMGGKSVEPPLGVEPSTEKGNYFFPNPAQTTINWKNEAFKRIDIYSVQGKLLKTVLPEKDSKSMPTTGLTTGIYLFNATDGKRNFVQKMLIEN